MPARSAAGDRYDGGMVDLNRPDLRRPVPGTITTVTGMLGPQDRPSPRPIGQAGGFIVDTGVIVDAGSAIAS